MQNPTGMPGMPQNLAAMKGININQAAKGLETSGKKKGSKAVSDNSMILSATMNPEESSEPVSQVKRPKSAYLFFFTEK